MVMVNGLGSGISTFSESMPGVAHGKHAILAHHHLEHGSHGSAEDQPKDLAGLADPLHRHDVLAEVIAHDELPALAMWHPLTFNELPDELLDLLLLSCGEKRALIVADLVCNTELWMVFQLVVCKGKHRLVDQLSCAALKLDSSKLPNPEKAHILTPCTCRSA